MKDGLLTSSMTTHLTKDGRKFIIRRPTESDAEALISYSKILFASTDQVLTTIEEYAMTLETEKIWINSFEQNSNSKVLIAELDNQITGLLFFMPSSKKKNSHVGEFGVSVHPKFQRIGIGRFLVQALLSWAKANTQIEKVFLNVFITNQNAIKLYQDLGFVVEGTHVKAIKQLTGEYVDVLQMYIETR